MDEDLNAQLVRIEQEVTRIRLVLTHDSEQPGGSGRTVREVKGNSAPVVITDLDMSFMSMVTFMVKWAIAVIPALLILMFIGYAVVAFFSGFFEGLSNQ